MPDYPPLPPGVMTFDPRRLRRHARKQAIFSRRREAEIRAKMEHERNVARRKLELARESLKREQAPSRGGERGVLGRIRRLFQRRAV